MATNSYQKLSNAMIKSIKSIKSSGKEEKQYECVWLMCVDPICFPSVDWKMKSQHQNHGNQCD